MLKPGAVEPLRVKTQAINSAADATAMILLIDDIIVSTWRGPGGAGGMPGGMRVEQGSENPGS